MLDTSFVVAKRLKYRMPITRPTRRTSTIASSTSASRSGAPSSTLLWVATLAAAALGTRFVPFRETATGTLADARVDRDRRRSRSAPRCTWSSCSRSSSWRTRACAAATRGGGSEPPQRLITRSRKDRRLRKRSSPCHKLPGMLALQMEPRAPDVRPRRRGRPADHGDRGGHRVGRADRLGGRVGRLGFARGRRRRRPARGLRRLPPLPGAL